MGDAASEQHVEVRAVHAVADLRWYTASSLEQDTLSPVVTYGFHARDKMIHVSANE